MVDNPKLDVRYGFGKNIWRIAFDFNERIPPRHDLLTGASKTIIITGHDTYRGQKNEKTEFIRLNQSERDLKTILRYIRDFDIQRLMIEGGSDTLQRFLNRDLWDEARIIKTEDCILTGVKSPLMDQGKKTTFHTIGNNEIRIVKKKTAHDIDPPKS